MNFEERWYQREAEASLYEYFTYNKGNPVVAMPGGTGKSVVIANFIRNAMLAYPRTRVMMLTHVKELIVQNASKLMSIWPYAPLGIHSAGLKQRDIMLPIIFGGVGSVAKTIEKALKEQSATPLHMRHFGHRDLLIIDECHLLGPNEDAMYQKVIAALLAINPLLKVIGFSATPYRMKQGEITDNGLFTDICYDCTKLEQYNRLIAEGYICPLIPKQPTSEIDLSQVSFSGYDFNQKELQKASINAEENFAMVKEIVKEGQNRKKWMMFASGIEHCELLAEMFRYLGVSCAAVHSKLKADENDIRIQAFKTDEMKCIVNRDKLTTGFDHPPIDFGGILRGTTSPGLWVQILSRFSRPFPDKQNSLILDFAGNTRRLGPINDPVKPRKPGASKGDAPVKLCVCGAYNHAGARNCCQCDAPFIFEQRRLEETASTLELVAGDMPQIEYFTVNKVLYSEHVKKNKEGEVVSRSLRCSYICGLRMFQEWINFEHEKPFIRHVAHTWWLQRSEYEPPPTNKDALEYSENLRTPARIRVHVNLKYPKVLSYEF